MATKWLKSLHCKTRALDDVVPRSHRRRSKAIIETKPHTSPFKRSVSRNPEPDPFPSLTELPHGHPSRNVVEIIFHTSWGDKSFSGDIEMVFKVQNLTRTVTRFEEYRDSVRSRVGSGEDHARCVADGNEVLRFYCLGAAVGSGAYDVGGCAWAKGPALCTYSGSGEAHEHAGGGGRGRCAMLVCRVIAGRVAKKPVDLLDNKMGNDSVSGEYGELVVFDPRAVLPCFLVIYKL